MLPLGFLARLLFLLAVVDRGVLARRGGGDHDGDGDGDSGSGSGGSNSGSDGNDGSNDSSGSGPSGCGSENPSNQLSTTYLVPSHALNWTSQAGANSAPSPAIFDGSYFQGQGHISYNATKGTCSSSKNLRVLGYAWIGPPPPYPQGSDNPFMIGFKAWASSQDVSEIHTSYSQIKWDADMCASQPDLFRIATTRGSANDDKASDTMALDVSDSGSSDAVRFNATTIQDLSPRIAESEGLFRLPASSCLALDTDMHWPDTTTMQGSITNNTMELKFSGSVDMNSTQYQFYSGRDEDLKVNFTVTFSGTFDSVNSTHSLNIQQGNKTLAWVSNSAVRMTSGGWAYTFWCMVGIQMIILGLW